MSREPGLGKHLRLAPTKCDNRRKREATPNNLTAVDTPPGRGTDNLRERQPGAHFGL